MALPTLKGDLINLRQIRRSDAESIQRHANDPDVAYFLPLMPHPYSLDDAFSWINTTHRLARKREGYHFGIELKETREVIGVIGLKCLNWKDSNSEVGYWLGRQFWRRGFVFEAVRLILGYSFNDLNLNRIWAIVHEINPSSARLLEKSGFTREGVWRKAFRRDNGFVDIISYGLLKEEFNQS